jgi:hypothetical protein
MLSRIVLLQFVGQKTVFVMKIWLFVGVQGGVVE